jgi:hypothetical protein
VSVHGAVDFEEYGSVVDEVVQIVLDSCGFGDAGDLYADPFWAEEFGSKVEVLEVYGRIADVFSGVAAI